MTADAGAPPADRPPRHAWWAVLTERWALVSAAAFLYWVASHSLRPFVVVRLDDLGATTGQVGLVVAAYAVVALFLAVPAGRAIDRFGVLRVAVLSMAAMVALGVAYAVSTSILQLVVLQVVNGVVELGVWMAVQTLATHAGAGDSLARRLAVFSFAWGLGIAVGPTLGGVIYQSVGFSVLAGTYAGLAALLLVAVALAPRTATPSTAHRAPKLGPHAWHLARGTAVRGVLVSSFVAMYIISIRSTFYPRSLQQRGIDLTVVGLLLSTMGIASLAVRLVLPALLRRVGAARVLVGGALLGAVAISLTPWLDHVALLAVAAALAGAGYGSNPPVAMQLLAERSDRSDRGLVMGLRATASRLAQVVQPLAFAGVVALAGTAAAFPVSGAALVLLTLLTRGEFRSLGPTDRVVERPVGPVPLDHVHDTDDGDGAVEPRRQP